MVSTFHVLRTQRFSSCCSPTAARLIRKESVTAHCFTSIGITWGSVSSMLTIVYYSAGSPRLPTRDQLASCKHTRLACLLHANFGGYRAFGHLASMFTFCESHLVARWFKSTRPERDEIRRYVMFRCTLTSWLTASVPRVTRSTSVEPGLIPTLHMHSAIYQPFMYLICGWIRFGTARLKCEHAPCVLAWLC